MVCFAWIRRYAKSLTISLLTTFGIAFVFAYIILKISLSKNKKLLLMHKDIAYADECFSYLSINKTACKTFFAKLLNPKQIIGNYYICNNTTYYINYQDEQLTNKNICAIKNSNHKNITICAHSLSQTAIQSCNKLNYAIQSPTDVFLLMKQKNIYPLPQTKSAKHIKNSIKNIIISAINRKKAKHYLLYGVLLLTISFIIPFTFMYCVFGTIFIIFGFLCYLIKPKESISK